MNRNFAKFFSMDNTLILIAALLLVFVATKRIISKKSIPEKNEPTLGVQTLVENVKTELEKVDMKRIEKNEAALFNIKTFDLEINFIAKKTESKEAKFDYQVITLGGGESIDNEQVQKIMLHFEALPPNKPISVKADDSNDLIISPKK